MYFWLALTLYIRGFRNQLQSVILQNVVIHLVFKVPSPVCLLVCLLETRSLVCQVGLELFLQLRITFSFQSSCLCFPSVGVTGMCHCTQSIHPELQSQPSRPLKRIYRTENKWKLGSISFLLQLNTSADSNFSILLTKMFDQINLK